MLRILLLLAALLPAADALADCCKVVEPAALGGLDAILPRLAERRVVYVGESHDQYGHHLAQLEVIRGMYRQSPDLAIGFEQFQQPFQGALDDFVAGRIDEGTMLERTEYFTRWRFDYRLYRPILQYARDHAIPLVALNVPAELSRKVGAAGLSGLDAAERAQLPAEMGAADDTYRARLRGIFDQHPGAELRNFDFFVDAQRVWDAGMAARVAGYLDEHPGRRMVVLAGVGHIAYHGAIPDRVARRGDYPAAVLACDVLPEETDGVDFVLYPQVASLPPAGMLGVFLDERPDGVYAKAFSPQSAAQAAGMREGDRIVAIADGAVGSLGELKSRMFERRPGETVSVEVEHPRFLLGPQRKRFEVTLR